MSEWLPRGKSGFWFLTDGSRVRMILRGETTVQDPAPQTAPWAVTGCAYLHGSC